MNTCKYTSVHLVHVHVHRLVDIINVRFVFKLQNSSNYLSVVHFVIII